MSTKRPRFGDIIEIPTSKGFAYAQYTQRKERWGDVIRVLPGILQTRPEDFSILAAQKESFVTLFPLRAAIREGIFNIVGTAPIPECRHTFPIFRAGIADKNGKVKVWWLWDGEKEWPIGKLKPEQRSLPIREIPNDAFLIHMIETGWTPENDRRR